ncbi:hypothetical protein AB6A40_000625 [Gnathostoma spinigerum]|uniref:Uncharacterized protein n=1 Tax=Gnathostoma spinigerum TaxID=75299 RepID=A0ABD6E970_9BILA
MLPEQQAVQKFCEQEGASWKALPQRLRSRVVLCRRPRRVERAWKFEIGFGLSPLCSILNIHNIFFGNRDASDVL